MPEQKEPTATKQLIPNQNNKLLEFQQRVSAISKDSVNPFFKSKYFDVNTVIDTIKPVLSEVELVIVQPLLTIDGKNVLATRIMDQGNILVESQLILPEIVDIQKFGAALTYLRRYALVSLLLLQGEEDDDGNGAVKPNSAPSNVQKPKAVSEASKGLAITPKQKTMINILLLQKGLKNLSEAGITKIENPTVADGSAIIKKLMDFKPEDNVTQEDTNQINEPYVPNHEGD